MSGQVPAAPLVPTLAVYALAHAGKTLFWVVSDIYFTWIVITVGGVAAGWAGLGIGLSILLAAGADYAGGRWLMRRIGDAAMAGRIQFLACLATGLAMVLFAAMGLWRPQALAWVMMAGLALFRITYAGLDITQNALPALIARTEQERAAYGMWRNIAGGMARIALSAGFVPLLLHRARLDQALNFLALALLVAMVATGAAALLRARLATHTQTAPPIPTEDEPPAMGMARLAGAMGVASLGMTLFQQLEPFSAARALSAQGAMAFMTASALVMVVCQPFWRMAVLRRGAGWLRRAIIAVGLLGAVAMAMPPGGGIAPVIVALAAGVAYGAAGGGCMLWLWIAALDCAPRQAVGRISSFSASAKLGQALGIVVACGVLQIAAPVAVLGMVMAGALVVMVVSMLLARPA